jgi:hypothetical protein
MKLVRLSFVAALTLAGAAQAQTLLGGNNRLSFPFFINQPGSYKLAGPIVVPAGLSGFVIAANDVTLDLNGYTVQGPNKCSPSPGGPGVVCTLADATLPGIQVTAAGGSVVVRNGTVRGFAGDGVYLGAGSRAEALTVTENAGLGLYVGSGSVAQGIVSRFNRRSGLYASGSVVSDVTADRNGEAGVGLHGTALLRGATLINNAGFAVSATTASGYRDVVMTSPSGAYGIGGVSLGGNLCGGVPC